MNSKDYNLKVYITHYVHKNASGKKRATRGTYLADLILSLARLNLNKVDIKIYTNFQKPNEFLTLSTPLECSEILSSFEVVVVPESEMNYYGVYNAWLLTWAHKTDLKVDVENSNGHNLYLYLEDDALFDQSNLDYFLQGREILREFGLIPSYVRAEWSSIQKCWINSDSFPGHQHQDYLLQSSINKSYKVCQYENPFYAAFLFDQELALEYIHSKSFELEDAGRKHPIIWDTGATAALGLICENIPQGFCFRTAVLLSEKKDFPVIGSVLRHQGDRYANDLWFIQRRLFQEGRSGELDTPKRHFWDYLVKAVKLGPKELFRILFSKLL